MVIHSHYWSTISRATIVAMIDVNEDSFREEIDCIKFIFNINMLYIR